MRLFRTFGSNPAANRLSKIEKSVNYKDGSFQNISETKLMMDNSSFIRNVWRFMNKPADTAPPHPLPSVKTDLRTINNDKPVIVWFGHSSYLVSIRNITILVDPVLSGHASPFSFGGKSFAGTDSYTTADLPGIDVLILTHDHYDHLDLRTISKLKPRHIYTSLGVGAHLVSWGFNEDIITELDWWESTEIAGNMELIAAPARHFSGRTFVRNKTLWSSFILRAGEYKIYIGGDSGYDTHFKAIGEKYGPFDIAMLEAGQYNEAWPTIHMMPEETVQACIDLRSKVLLPVHWGKFAIALHPWDEPVKRILKKAAELNVKVTTPLIGEPVVLGSSYPDTRWWEAVHGS